MSRIIKTKVKKENLSQAEKRIVKIGGALERDFHHLCNILHSVNTDYFPLFYLMEFDNPEDKDIVIDILLGSNIFYGAKAAYIARGEERVASGELRLESLLSKRTLNKEYPTPEEREKVFKREVHRALTFRYNKIEETFHKEYRPSLTGFYKYPLKVCRGALSLSSEGFTIDGDKFIEIYKDYMEASGSQTGKLHQAAADAINRFFGGQVEVTDKELERYFILEHGIMKPNPKSINSEDYMRLGYRPELEENKS